MSDKLTTETRLLGEAWDEMDSAAQRVCNALPHQMTVAAANLDHARKRMRSVLQSFLAGRALLAAAGGRDE